jgi:pyrroloquinoline quinone biosynthesis protein D
MNTRALIDAQSVPKLAPHMRLRFDKARENWTIQAPERSFFLDEIAHAVVSRCDGVANIGGIVESLCAAFPGAPPDIVEKDVVALIQDFIDKSVMQS